MKQIVVVSGKGGTGKSTMAASFAVLAERSVIVDADVDAADLHLLMNPRKQRENDFYSGLLARIDPQLCTRCGECLQACRFGGVTLDDDGEYRIDETGCEGCAVCSRVCPVEAISMDERLNGKWFVSETDYGPMVHARLGIAAENSGKLVTLLRRQAAEIAENGRHELVVIDGPPGIGCPVMAAVTGADLLICVAEPTVSGVHDLGRILDLADHFGIRATVIINKCDINPDMNSRIREDCDSRGVGVIAEVPYDSDVIGAIVNSTPLVKFSGGPASSAVSAAWDELLKSHV